jgi:hypothetical protein
VLIGAQAIGGSLHFTSTGGIAMAAALELPIRREKPDPAEIRRQYETLKGERGTWDTHWQDVKDRCDPHGADFTTQRQTGSKRTEKMLDSTAALAGEKFPAILESLLTPRQQRYQKLVPSDPALKDDLESKKWLEMATDWLFKVRAAPRSGYYTQKHENYKSLGFYGNQCLFIEPHKAGGLRYTSRPISRTYVAINQYRQIDTIFYCYKQTAKQSVQEWGEKAPEKAKQALEKGQPFQEHEYLHVVRPNAWQDTFALGPRAMPWESVYLCLDDNQVIDVGGYRHMRYYYSRYTVNPDEVYGRSPAMLVLGNIKILQEQKATFLRAGHKVVDPPLLIHDDGVLGTGGKALKLRPGGLNYGGLDAQGRPMIAPLITGARLDLTFEMQEEEKGVIHDAFLVRLFEILIDDPTVKTATEILARAHEKGILLAPAVGRQQSEMLGPETECELSLGISTGQLPPPPPQLTSYEVEYDSPATQYQKQAKLVGISRSIEVALPGLQTDPGLMLKYKWEDIIDESADALGVPVDLIRTQEEYAEARAKYDQQQAAQAQMAMLQAGAGAAKDMAGAASAMPEQPVA